MGERRWRDPEWFPLDLDVPNGSFLFSSVSQERLAAASFLDNRFEADWNLSERVAIDEPEISTLPRCEMGWLWHTSFCGSTLLARAMDVAPWATVLREPLVLRRLSDARNSGYSLASALPPTLALLSRRWHAEGRVLIKPTHAALNMGRDVAAAALGDRAILLTSSLDDFLTSNLKKTPETLAKAATLAERALRAGDFVQRLPPEAFNPPDELCAVALQWAAQRELAADLADAIGAGLCVVDARQVFGDLAAVAVACARWLRLEIPEQRQRAHCAAISSVHAKSPRLAYDAQRRALEKESLQARFARPLHAARAWAERYVLGSMRDVALKMSP